MGLKTSLSDFISSRHRSAQCGGLFGAYDCVVNNEKERSYVKLQKENGELRFKKCLILERGPDILMKFILENISTRRLKFISESNLTGRWKTLVFYEIDGQGA